MASSDLPPLSPEYLQAIALIDEAHAQDPKKVPRPENDDGAEDVPYELHYARKMTAWLAKRSPQASPALQLACRAQHFKRWEIPRNTFPMTRPGYLTWRSKQKTQAASQVSELLQSPSLSPAISDDVRSRVAALIRKEGLSSSDADPETQALEDVACLVFLDDQFDDFEKQANIDEKKMVGILRKTWGKMGEQGRQLALQMQHSDRAMALITRALQE